MKSASRSVQLSALLLMIASLAAVAGKAASAQDKSAPAESAPDTPATSPQSPPGSPPASDEVATLMRQLDETMASVTKEQSLQEFRQVLLQACDLINQIIKIAPDDPRAENLLYIRWGHLRMLSSDSAPFDHHAALNALKSELASYRETATNPVVKNAAANFSTLLKLDEPIDGVAPATTVEDHIRQWPDDAHADKLIERAFSKLWQSRIIRWEIATSLVLFAVTLAVYVFVQQNDRFERHRKLIQSLFVSIAFLSASGLIILSSNTLTSKLIPSERIVRHLDLDRENAFNLLRSPRFGAMVLLALVIGIAIYRLTRRRSHPSQVTARLQPLAISATVLALVLFIDQKLIAQRINQLHERLIKDFPNSPRARHEAARLRQELSIGKPFELDFIDAISGQRITMESLRGKVVVIDFWATWCGPCRREIPQMKRLYAKYHDQGVEFIGISQDQPIDEGGLDSLRSVVEKEQIPWPQYYHETAQPPTGAVDPSKYWGINMIPTVFIIDQSGNLYSSEARGRLEKLIPQLLARKHTE